MLRKTHFVENVEQTPRGIYISASGEKGEDFYFYKNGHVYEDPIQAFHEVRLNWSSDLYIEIAFERTWESPQYLAVLEDNPYARWNDRIVDEQIDEMKLALTYASLEVVRESLLDKINNLLIVGDKETFERLTKNLEEIESQIDEIAPKE